MCWEYCDLYQLVWSYTDKGLPNEVKRESRIPTSSCDGFNGAKVIGSATRTKNASFASDAFMTSLSTFMNNQLLSAKIDASLVNKKQELEIEALAVANDATKDKHVVESTQEHIRSRKVDEWLEMLSSPGVSEAMKGIAEAAIQALMN